MTSLFRHLVHSRLGSALTSLALAALVAAPAFHQALTTAGSNWN